MFSLFDHILTLLFNSFALQTVIELISFKLGHYLLEDDKLQGKYIINYSICTENACSIIDKDYISLTTPFMESMALIATEYAVLETPVDDMSIVFSKVNKAASWINHQRSSTTVSQMEFFKSKRHMFFKQWDIGGRGPARDGKGQFLQKARSETEVQLCDAPCIKRSRLEDYGDVFAAYL